MASKWPEFVTKDLPRTAEGDAEMQRRWETYDREMKALIAAGGVHQDEDGWWIDDATGALIGPDPEIERPSTDDDLKDAKPFRKVFPDLAASIDREKARRGRPKVEAPKVAVTLRVDPDVLDTFKAKGNDWRSKMNDALRRAAGL